jgi:excisionase family DNA binding protein
MPPVTLMPRSSRHPRSGVRANDAEPSTGRASDARLLTVAQFAALSQVSERHVRRMIRKGIIRVIRYGRSIRIPSDELGI